MPRKRYAARVGVEGLAGDPPVSRSSRWGPQGPFQGPEGLYHTSDIDPTPRAS